MRSRSLATAAATCAALAFAAPAIADSGNTASDSTGVVQIGTATVDPAVDASTPFGGATATMPGGSTSHGTGGNTTSRSTGVVQSSPFSTRSRAHLSTGKSSLTASAPAGVGEGDNSAASSTGAVQVGGGNSTSGSTGAAQSGGFDASPTATATPNGGSSSTVGLNAGVPGSGNSAGNSTGAVQVGGGNAATGSRGTAQSAAPTAVPALGLATPPGASDLLQLFSVEGSAGSGSAPGSTSAAGVAGSQPIPAKVATPASHPVATQATKHGNVRVQGQGTSKRRAAVLGRAQALAGRALAGTLPFTGRNLAVWAIAALLVLGTGVALRRSGVAVR